MNKSIAKSHTPKLKAEEWIALTNEIGFSTTFDEVALKRNETEIRSVISRSKDPVVLAVCHQCLGSIAAIRRDTKSLLREYEIAMSLSVDRTLSVNYAMDLRRASAFGPLRKLANDLLKSYGDDITVLRELVNSYLALGDFITVDFIRRRLASLNKSADFFNGTNPIFVERFSQRATSLGVDAEKISALFDSALSAIESQGFLPHGTGFVLDPADWSASVRFVVEGTPEQRVMLGTRIADTIVSNFDEDFSDLITFGVMAPREAGNALKLK